MLCIISNVVNVLTWSAALREVSVCSAFILCRFIRSVFTLALFPPGAVRAQSQAACSLPGRCLQASFTLLQAPLPCNVHYAVPFLLNTTAMLSVNAGITSVVLQWLNICSNDCKFACSNRTLNPELIRQQPAFKVTKEKNTSPR